MSLRSFATRFAVTLLVGMVPVLAGAQARTDGTETWTPSCGADGRPDLQGVWDFRTITPLQRPAPLGDREVLIDEETAAFEAQAAQAGLTERFTRVGPDTLLYEFTVRDPRTCTHPFTAAVPMKSRTRRSSSTPVTRATTAWSTSCPGHEPRMPNSPARGCVVVSVTG